MCPHETITPLHLFPFEEKIWRRRRWEMRFKNVYEVDDEEKDDYLCGHKCV